MKKTKASKTPFFAKFLENQKIDQTDDLKGGAFPPFVTLKYPSDNDEEVTLKYPSDNDDDGPLF